MRSRYRYNDCVLTVVWVWLNIARNISVLFISIDIKVCAKCISILTCIALWVCPALLSFFRWCPPKHPGPGQCPRKYYFVVYLFKQEPKRKSSRVDSLAISICNDLHTIHSPLFMKTYLAATSCKNLPKNSVGCLNFLIHQFVSTKRLTIHCTLLRNLPNTYFITCVWHALSAQRRTFACCMKSHFAYCKVRRQRQRRERRCLRRCCRSRPHQRNRIV